MSSLEEIIKRSGSYLILNWVYQVQNLSSFFFFATFEDYKFSNVQLFWPVM